MFNDHDEEKKLTLVHLASCRNFSVKRRREAFKMRFKELAIKIYAVESKVGEEKGDNGVLEKKSKSVIDIVK